MLGRCNVESIKEIFEYMISQFHYYYGEGIWLLLAILSGSLLMFKGNKKHRFIVISSIVIYAVIFNPFIYKYLLKQLVFWRLFWLVPTFLLIVLGFALLLQLTKQRYKRFIITFIAMAVLVLFGSNVFNNLARDSYTGIYKLPRGTEAVGQMMLSLNDHPRCILPYELLTGIRMYSGDIEPMYGRNVDGFINQPTQLITVMNQLMSEEYPSYDVIFDVARDNGYNFVVNSENKPAGEASLMRYGYELAGTVEGYNVYYNPDTSAPLFGHIGLNEDDLVITQYGNNEYGQPSMFYTIEDMDGHLVVVDGGNADEADFVMSRIRLNGNHVDAWILTHPHPDHIGAFNEIYRNYVLGDGEHITIDNIYAIDIPSDYYNEIAQPWDDISTFNEFVQLADTMNNLTYVERGETYDVGRISFEVYNTFTDESYDIPTGSLPNACTMVLEVFTPSGDDGESMLFLGDLEQGNADLIAGLFGDELQADYVQAAHHGQNVDYPFYELIGAHTATVDAPEWLRQENPDSHTAFEHLQWFEANNITVLTYDTTPNVIILHAED